MRYKGKKWNAKLVQNNWYIEYENKSKKKQKIEKKRKQKMIGMKR